MTRTTSFFKALLAAFAAAGLLAGCVTNPAPVVNHSFGPGEAIAPGPVTSAQTPATSGAQTFGLGGHANGTTTSAGYTVARGDTLYSIAFAHGLDVRTLAGINSIPPPYVIHPGQLLQLESATSSSATSTQVATAPARPAPVIPPAPVFGPVTTHAANPVAGTPTTASASATVAAQTGAPPVAAPPPTLVPVAGESPTAAAPAPVQPRVAPPPGATRNAGGITWRWPAEGDLISGFQAGSGGDGAGLDIAGKAGDPVRAAASGTVVYSGNGLIGYGELVIIKHNDTYLSAYGHNSKRLVKEGQHVDAGQEIALMGASGAPRVELHFEIRKNGKPVDPMGYLPQR